MVQAPRSICSSMQHLQLHAASAAPCSICGSTQHLRRGSGAGGVRAGAGGDAAGGGGVPGEKMQASACVCACVQLDLREQDVARREQEAQDLLSKIQTEGQRKLKVRGRVWLCDNVCVSCAWCPV